MHPSRLIITLNTVTTGVLSRGIEQRAAVSKAVATITTTETILSTITTTSSLVIATGIDATGAQEIIPGILTMTFNEVPAYLYLETIVVDTTVSTDLKTRTVKVTSTVKPAQKTSSSTSTSASSTAIATKPLGTCNVEGKAGSTQSKYAFGQSKTNNILDCQQDCFFTTACQSYSYNVASMDCTKYSYGAGGMDVVQGATNTFFSQKYPGDGTNFCYGSTGY